MILKQLRKLTWLFLSISVLFLINACSDPIIENGVFIVGQNEGMKIVRFNPPDTSSFLYDLEIDLDKDDESDIVYGSGINDYGHCPTYTTWTHSRSTESVLFLSVYEEHAVYYKDSTYSLIYGGGETVWKDSLLHIFKDFDPISDSIIFHMGKYVHQTFEEGDIVPMEGNWKVDKNFLQYDYSDSNIEEHLNFTICREPVEIIERGDTLIRFYHARDYKYIYDNALQAKGGKYVVFKWDDGERERFGWVKLRVIGSQVIMLEYTVERKGF